MHSVGAVGLNLVMGLVSRNSVQSHNRLIGRTRVSDVEVSGLVVVGLHQGG